MMVLNLIYLSDIFIIYNINYIYIMFVSTIARNLYRFSAEPATEKSFLEMVTGYFNKAAVTAGIP